MNDARSVRIVGQRETVRLLGMRDCIAAMERVLASSARGEVILPLRKAMAVSERGSLMTMPGALADPPIFGLKAIAVHLSNHGTPFDSHQGAVLVYGPPHGRLRGIVDATAITAIRTAAVSAVATGLLARRDASRLAILGSGTQARTHLEAIRITRSLTDIVVWSRTPANAERFARIEGERYGVEIRVALTARDAVRAADIVCTTTSSFEPVLLGEWIVHGTHINAAGSSVASARELDGEAMRRSSLYVDRRESTLNESGDFLMALREGAITSDHIRGEIGEILVGRNRGRERDDEITLFKSLGLAIEDLAAASLVLDRAEKDPAGLVADFGGLREV